MPEETLKQSINHLRLANYNITNTKASSLVGDHINYRLISLTSYRSSLSLSLPVVMPLRTYLPGICLSNAIG